MSKASGYCPQCVVKDKELAAAKESAKIAFAAFEEESQKRENAEEDLASEQRWASQYKQELEAEMQAHAATIQREAKVSLDMEAARQRITDLSTYAHQAVKDGLAYKSERDAFRAEKEALEKRLAELQVWKH